MKWFRKAAEQNHADAQNWLGVCYNNGQGVAKNMTEAMKWYWKAAVQGNEYAQYNLGVCHSDGETVAKHRDPVDAIMSLPDPLINLGLAKLGVGSGHKDPVEAAKWFRKAAEQGQRKCAK